MWISPALPGSTHDLTAARHPGIIDALTDAQVMTFADKGCRGARSAVSIPFHGRNLPEPMREVDRSHANIRTIGERAIVTLKTWNSWPSCTAAHAAPPQAAGSVVPPTS